MEYKGKRDLQIRLARGNNWRNKPIIKRSSFLLLKHFQKLQYFITRAPVLLFADYCVRILTIPRR